MFHIVQTLVILCLLLTACRSKSRDTQTVREDRSGHVDTAPLEISAIRKDTGGATRRIHITGPTVILAVSRSLAHDAVSSQEANEGLGDVTFYFGRAASFLEDRGVRSVIVAVDTLVIEQDNTDTTIVIETEPLYYVTTPGKHAVYLFGIDGDHELVSLAVNYFWGGKVPVGRGDTLTAATAAADFVVTRPTIIGYFSRRMLDISYRGHGPSPAIYGDSSLLVDELQALRDTLNSAGIDVEIALRNRFTVFGRGRVDSISLSGMGRTLGYFVAAPDNWRTRYIDAYRPRVELIQELRSFLDSSVSPVGTRAPNPR